MGNNTDRLREMLADISIWHKWWLSDKTSAAASLPDVNLQKLSRFSFLSFSKNWKKEKNMKQLCLFVSTAAPPVSGIQLMRALWYCFQIFVHVWQFSHFFMKLFHHFLWQWSMAWCVSFYFPNFPSLAEPRGGSEKSLKQLFKPDEHFKLHKFGWRVLF